ncbi:hypothetical protein JAAARDRAFT_59145 [Jaapia argillacea MUCL 33604]|uniref:Uncharacterized protein n=1 Tax=Jaapia argillacea MUCL 33604 TaxID=933084 RepID=A0A067PN68_9AGAM|nr:hypothetical protein JAAARDRAFT_59145 [Jaapia argillacea MUCL 33604]
MASVTSPSLSPLTSVHSTPAPALPTKFSEDYFRDLTFRDCLGLQLPPSAPAGSLRCWILTAEESVVSELPTVGSDEVVPHSDDLQAIMRQYDAEWNAGKRFVSLQLVYDGKSIFR